MTTFRRNKSLVGQVDHILPDWEDGDVGDYLVKGSTDSYIWDRTSAGGVSVKAYGAVGDGTTDDTAAIQLAIDSVTAGETIFFPDGVYRCTDNITIDKNIKLEAEHSELASRLLWDTAITRTVQTTATHPDDGQDAAISAALTIDATGVELHNLVIDLFVDYSDNSPTNFGTDIDIGIFIKSRARVILRTCRTRGYWRIAGVYADCTTDFGTCDRLSMYDCRFQGFWSVYIQGAKVKSGESEILAGDNRGSGGVSDLNAIRCWFEGWSHHSNVRGSDVDGGCLYVDGKLFPTSAINAIQGRNWINCRFDGADPFLIKLNNCIRDKFLNSFVDRKAGFFKTDTVTGVGTADCELELSAGSQHIVFEDTDIYRTTLTLDSSATYEFHRARDVDLSITVPELTFLPALAFGTGITYNSRSGTYVQYENRIFFRIEMDMSNIGTADASQVNISGIPTILDNKFVSANVAVESSTALVNPEIAVIGVVAANGGLGLWKATGGTLAYTDCNTSGVLNITGWAFV